MLPRENRLKKKNDFEKVFKKGKGYKEDFLFLKIVKNELAKARFGIIVSQKVSKKATIRNRLKRQLREILRKKLPEIKKGIDGVFIARPGIEKKDFSALEKIVENLLRKARL